LVLLSGSVDGSVRVWNMETKVCLQVCLLLFRVIDSWKFLGDCCSQKEIRRFRPGCCLPSQSSFGRIRWSRFPHQNLLIVRGQLRPEFLYKPCSVIYFPWWICPHRN
jgi:hypothetical protein